MSGFKYGMETLVATHEHHKCDRDRASPQSAAPGLFLLVGPASMRTCTDTLLLHFYNRSVAFVDNCGIPL